MLNSIEKFIVKSNPIEIGKIRKSQLEHNYIIPSDYVYILMEYGCLRFSEIMSVKFQNSNLDLDEFYDLELIEWQIKHTKTEKIVLQHNFWLENYLCIGQITSKHILIGTTRDNVNQIFLYDNEEANIDFVSSSIFEFLNKYFNPFINSIYK